MAEYIDKSVLIAMCKGIAAFDWNKKVAPVSWADAYERFADEVEDFDAADVVEVKRGEWRTVKLNRENRTVIVECTECGSVFDLTLFACGLNYNFCPNCGCLMGGD